MEEDKRYIEFLLNEDVIELIQQLAKEQSVSLDEWLRWTTLNIHAQRHQVRNGLTGKYELVRCGKSTCFIEQEEEVHHIWETRKKANGKQSKSGHRGKRNRNSG